MPTTPKPFPPVEPFEDAHKGELQPDLKAILERVGRENYAATTAPLFVRGGKYNRKRQRFAIT